MCQGNEELEWFSKRQGNISQYEKVVNCIRVLMKLGWYQLFQALFGAFASTSCGKTFFFPFIFISWRLITLQYCSGFCHTLT